MSDDLISRSYLLEQYGLKDCTKYGNETAEQQRKSYDTMMMYEIVGMIEDAPTAYDVDKVAEKLQKELSLADKEKERCARENPLQFDAAKGYAHGISVALENVKFGGVADE